MKMKLRAVSVLAGGALLLAWSNVVACGSSNSTSTADGGENSGGEGGRLPGLADPLLLVPSKTTARIQEMHIALGQMLCAGLERELGLV